MNGATWLLIFALIFNTALQVTKGFMLEEKGKEIAALQAEIDMMNKSCDTIKTLK